MPLNDPNHWRTPTRSIALINQKGGVGKTTTAVNLAAGVARLGRRALLIDLDPQAHASLHLGAEPGPADLTVYDLLIDTDARADDAIIEIEPNLQLIPSLVDLAAAETELASEPNRQDRLRRSLAGLQAPPEFLFIDCPPSLGLLTLNALAAVREVVIPMQAHFLALQGVGKLLETVGLVGRGVNPQLVVSSVVLTSHEEQTTLAKEIVADLDAFFASQRQTDNPWRSARVRRPAIRRNIKLAECPSFGKTIFDYAPKCAGAEDYASLAQSFVREWDSLLERIRERRASGNDAETPGPRGGVTVPDEDRLGAS
ncbi:MAG: ParA family protein [Phycisphaeraceae bacterium]|nr:ParA family protein [Phycisphaeraceae bacterium]